MTKKFRLSAIIATILVFQNLLDQPVRATVHSNIRENDWQLRGEQENSKMQAKANVRVVQKNQPLTLDDISSQIAPLLSLIANLEISVGADLPEDPEDFLPFLTEYYSHFHRVDQSIEIVLRDQIFLGTQKYINLAYMIYQFYKDTDLAKPDKSALETRIFNQANNLNIQPLRNPPEITEYLKKFQACKDEYQRDQQINYGEVSSIVCGIHN